MKDPINIVTFKWQRPKTGYRLRTSITYDATHVNNLYNSIKRNTSLPFTFTCVTDDPTGISDEIKIVKLWDKCKYLGGCFNRLFIFSKEIEKILGKRFICIDLDCVIVDNIDSILDRDEDFVINQYRSKSARKQLYNGGLILLTAGSRSKVWEEFDFNKSPKILDNLRNKLLVDGSDQAWIQHCLGENEKVFTNEDGIYDINYIWHDLPKNAKMVFFPGKYDPKIEKDKIDWVKDNWK